MDYSYDWDVDGYMVTSSNSNCNNNNGNCTGTSSTDSNGIVLTNLENNQHQILITPHEEATPGWGNAFGYFDDIDDSANNASNKNKLISLDAPLTTMAFSPKTTESTTNASYMFAAMFFGCTNLINSATIINTYKLPDTFTDLSYFLYRVHTWDSSIQTPINLSGLSDWINANNTITNLSNFLQSTHSGGTNITSPIDLSPLSGWFNANTSSTPIGNIQTYDNRAGITPANPHWQ